MVRLLVVVVVVVIVALLAYAAIQPGRFQIRRSIRIHAPPDRVFSLINDFEQFNRWNPWLKKDPTTKGTYGEKTSGPGARYAWDSAKIGSGEMTVVESTAPAKVALKLDFVRPFEAHNDAEFSISPDGDGSQVSWTMTGPSPLLSRVMQIFISMEKMVGPDFEAGLAALKALAEAR